MEEKQISNSNVEGVNDIILELKKSDVTDEPSVFNSFNEDETCSESKIENDVLDSRIHLESTGDKNDAEKPELDLLLEKDLSDIDFEISKDMFDEIKIKEDDVAGIVENVSSLISIDGSQKNDINNVNIDESSNGNAVVSTNAEMKKDSEEVINDFVSDNQQMETTLEECMEIPFNLETEKVTDVSCDKNEAYSNSINEIKRIMTELQATSLPYKNDQTEDSVSESSEDRSKLDNSINFQDVSEVDEIDTEKLEDLIFSSNENSSLSALESPVIGEPTDVSYADSIQAVMEAVIQKSIQQDDETDLPEQENTNETHDEKKRKLGSSTENDDSEKKTYGVFEVIVPLIGKNVIKLEDDVPFTHRYDLARKRNEMRAKTQKNDPDFPIPSMSFEEWRKKKESRSEAEIAAEERKKVINAVQLAKCFTKFAIKILSEYEKDEPNETAMIKYFRYFELAPASPLSLLYSPHFVHTMMLCRGDEDLSYNLRRAANECYDKCHALFPIPEGYNFETVYTSEVKKYVPKDLDHLSEYVLDYGDYDSSEFEDDASDCSSGSDKDWE